MQEDFHGNVRYVLVIVQGVFLLNGNQEFSGSISSQERINTYVFESYRIETKRYVTWTGTAKITSPGLLRSGKSQ